MTDVYFETIVGKIWSGMNFGNILRIIVVAFSLSGSVADARQHLLKLIAVDDQTGTQFFMMYEEDLITKRPRPPSTCRQHFGALEVIGKVPSNVSLRDDTVAKLLVVKGRRAADKICPKFLIKYSSPLRIKLFRGKYDGRSKPVVVMTWKSGNRKIVEEYHNVESQRAKEEAMIASGKLRPLPNNHFLFQIGTDRETRTEFWRFTRDRSRPCWLWSGGISHVIGVVPKSVSLLNDRIARSLVMRGARMSVDKCKSLGESTKVFLVPVGYQVRVSGYYEHFYPLKIVGSVWRGSRGEKPPKITSYKNYVVEAERKRLKAQARAEREAARQRRWSEFVRKHRVKEITSASSLDANAFVYQGKVVAIRTAFTRMVSPDTGVFGDGNIIVSGIPRDLFRSRSVVVLAGRVMGRKDKVPHLKFVGVHVCETYNCSDILPQR